MASVKIRPIEKSDEEQWRALFSGYCEFYNLKLDPAVVNKTWERFFDQAVDMHASVAVSTEALDKLIGFVHWITHLTTLSTGDYIYLHDLYVDPTSRNQGVGRKLIETVYEAGDKIGAAKVYWQTQMDNHRAQLLYTKVGVRNGFIAYQKPN